MSDKQYSLLVPVDFNEQSLVALQQSYNLARLLQYEIVLLYVQEEKDFLNSLFSAEQKQQIAQDINQKLEQIASEVSRATAVRVSPLVKKGKVHTNILDVADKYNSRFILMGTNDSVKSDEPLKNMIGSNTSKVIRQSKVPVIAFNGKTHFNGCRSILLPLDLTKDTRQKVTYAIEMAKLFGSTIKVISVLWDKDSIDIKQHLIVQLKQVQHFIKEAGIVCMSELIETGNTQQALVPAILDYVHEESDIDLIMIMTQQENRMIEFFIGSAAQQILRQSEVPVMSIIPRDLGFSYYQF
ncbi:MAG: universal stress protein [Bacteroidetes bacterium]|jgi:nucleotide-binding universal stress UspA family protein|nr:universal stress protein [Bacteroidota bacterium]MBU1578648.1 universal stress protein [Bacteroidota bacterium]MBU2466654.1 universal stress protein [Bacteroidota bacterium]MBU2558361.1 universal stress protein [Bacteroidota bacterium]MDA3942163.1 universal stress protein [Bacteroidota bacterium]